MRSEDSKIHSASLIRYATSADVKSLARVHVDSWWETYKNIIPESFLHTLKYTDRQHMWEKLIPRRVEQGCTLIVPDENDDVVGFADIGPAREHEHGLEGEVYAIYLLRRYHGSGIGRRLFELIIEEFKKRRINSFYLWVLKDNPTKGFYEKLGGRYLKSQPIDIGGDEFIEDLYFWEL